MENFPFQIPCNLQIREYQPIKYHLEIHVEFHMDCYVLVLYSREIYWEFPVERNFQLQISRKL